MSVQDETWDRVICIDCGKTIKYGESHHHGNGICDGKVTNFPGQCPKNEVNSDMIKQIALDIRQRIKHIPETIVHVDGEYSIVVKSYIHRSPIVIRNTQREIPCNNVVEALELIEVLKKKHLEIDD